MVTNQHFFLEFIGFFPDHWVKIAQKWYLQNVQNVQKLGGEKLPQWILSLGSTNGANQGAASSTSWFFGVK